MIPLVGERPFKVKRFLPMALVLCPCTEAGEPVLIVGREPTICPRCSAQLLIGVIHYEQGKSLHIEIGIVQRPPPEGGPGARV